MKITLAIVAALACTGTASANITVTGTGKVTYVPNVGYVSVSVSTDADTASAAWDKNSKAVKKLFDVLKSFGIDPKDYKTAGLHVSPRYTEPEAGKVRKLIGYTVSYDLSITVRQLPKIGALLDGLVAAGANRNVGISFGHDNPESLLDQARRSAVADARRKANLYATGAGASLGQVVAIDEGQGYQPKMYRLDYTAKSGAAEALMVAAGSQEMSASVTIVWAVGRDTPAGYPWNLPSRTTGSEDCPPEAPALWKCHNW